MHIAAMQILMRKRILSLVSLMDMEVGLFLCLLTNTFPILISEIMWRCSAKSCVYKAFWEMHYNLTRIKLLNRQIISFSHFYDISLQILKVLSCFFSLSFLFLLWQMLVITMQGLKSDASTRVPLVWNPMRVRECRSCESRKEHLNQSFVRLAYNILNKDSFVN